MRILFTFLTLLSSLLIPSLLRADDVEDALRRLDHVVERRDTYYTRHAWEIDSVKQVLGKVPETDHKRRISLLHDIFQRYSSFQGDSAQNVADREIALARILGEPDLIARAQCDKLLSMISKGNFTDAVDLARSINLAGATDRTRGYFYHLCNRLYSDISNYKSDDFSDDDAIRSRAYADSVIAVMPKGSFLATFASIFRSFGSMSISEKIETFSNMLERKDISNSDKALIASILGDLYREAGDNRLAVIFKSRAAILDITEAKRETSAIETLSEWMYSEGDNARASRYINVALEDASFFNAPHRKSRIAGILTLIETSRYNSVDRERRTLRWAIAGMVVLLAALLAAVFFYLRALRKARRRGRQLSESTEKLQQANSELAEINSRYDTTNKELHDTLDKYRESVRIKDEYIGSFLFAQAESLKKISGIYTTARRRMMARQYDEVLNMFSVSDLHRQQEAMHTDFDKIFLRLFPSFTERYLNLFPEETRAGLMPPEEGVLTPEMRIFALIRLGVTDASKIADFLSYSVNTINTYKTRAKKRSLIPNEKFEDAIMKIPSIA